jgi:uncharacterized protein with FMN-binding domain
LVSLNLFRSLDLEKKFKLYYIDDKLGSTSNFMQPQKKLNPVIIALIVIVLVGIAVALAVTTQQPEQAAVSETRQKAAAPAGDAAIKYKAGTYTEKGRYASPGGGESIDVTVTITDDIITSASVSPNATSEQAKQYQGTFVSGYKSLVVGKNVDEVSLSRVAGSSLTSTGFNNALELIKADARA